MSSSMPLGGGSFRSPPTIDLGHVPPAPRRPSPRARELIFGYQGSQKIALVIGVIFVAMGSLFSLIFCWGLPSDIALSVAGSRAQGTVVAADVQRDVRVNGSHPTRITFRYEVGGASHEGSSSTRSPELLRQATPGATIPIEVLSGSPGVARVEGTTCSSFGYRTMFVLLFPIVGLLLVRSTLRANHREIRAFTRGSPILAQVTFAGPDTSASVNGRHPFMIRWSFTVNDRPFSGSLTNMDAGALRPLVDDEHVIVLYDPADPSINTAFVA